MNKPVKWILIGSGIFVLVLVIAIVGYLISLPRALTETEVREIVREEIEALEVAKEEEAQEEIEVVEEAKTKKEAEIGSKENPYSINESITINNEVNWKILLVDDLEVSAGRWIRVRFTVKNVGKEMKTLTALKLFDDEDREFVTLSEMDNINPGLEGTYTVSYEVPTDSKGFILEVTNLEFISDKAYISLGL